MENTFSKKIKHKLNTPQAKHFRDASKEDKTSHHNNPAQMVPTSPHSVSKVLMKLKTNFQTPKHSQNPFHQTFVRAVASQENLIQQSQGSKSSLVLERNRTSDNQRRNPIKLQLDIVQSSSVPTFDIVPPSDTVLSIQDEGCKQNEKTEETQGGSDSKSKDTLAGTVVLDTSRKKKIEECQVAGTEYEKQVYTETLQRELSLIRSKCTALNQALNQMEEEREKQKNDVKLEREKFILVKDVLMKENEYYKNQYKIARKLINKYKDKLGEECVFNEEALTLEEKTLIQRIEHLVGVVGEVSAKFRAGEGYIQEIKTNNTQWEKEFNRMMEHYEERLKGTQKDAMEACEDYEGRITELESLVGKAQQENCKLTQKVTENNKQIQQLRQKTEQFQKQLATVEKQLGVVRGQLEETLKQLKETEQQLKDYMGANQQFAKANKDLYERIEDLRANNIQELDNFNRALADLIYIKSSDIHIYRMTISQLKSELKITKEMADTTQKEYREFQDKLGTIGYEQSLAMLKATRVSKVDAEVQAEEDLEECLFRSPSIIHKRADASSQRISGSKEYSIKASEESYQIGGAQNQNQDNQEDGDDGNSLSFEPYQEEKNSIIKQDQIVMYQSTMCQTQDFLVKQTVVTTKVQNRNIGIDTELTLEHLDILYRDIYNLERQNCRLVQLNEQAEKELTRLKEDPKPQAQLEQLAAKIDWYEEEINKKEYTISQLENTVNKLSTEHQDLTTKLVNLEEAEEENQLSISRLKSQLEEKDSHIDRLQEDLVRTHSDNQILNNTARSNKVCEKCQEYSQKLQALEVRLQESEQNEQRCQISMTQIQNENEDLKEQIRRIRGNSSTTP